VSIRPRRSGCPEGRISTGPAINGALRDYCTSDDVSREWDHAPEARLLHGWAERFNDTFGLNLPTPVIVIDRLRSRGPLYQAGRNGSGLLHTLRVDSRSVAIPLAVRLAVLLRELLREWRTQSDGPGSARYYDVRLRRRAAECGLSFDPQGRLRAVGEGPFTELLERHGIETAVLRGPLDGWFQRAGASRMKKWACACTVVRAATALEAVCLRCGQQFRLADP
jgi:hypothetical protein